MVRTRDNANVKASGAKAIRKIAPAPAASTSGSGSGSDSKNKYAGGNPYCPRETPAWQKPITTFFGAASHGSEEAGASGSGGCSKDSDSEHNSAPTDCSSSIPDGNSENGAEDGPSTT